MTIYPAEFHRRFEQKWVLRAQASSGFESTPRATLVGRSQRGQRRSGQSERRDILARSSWLRELGQWLRAEYNAADQPVPERLSALPKELKVAVSRISARRSASICGRPPRGRDFQRQYRRKPARCRRTRVSGRMIVMVFRTDGNHRYSRTRRSPFVSWTRPRTFRRNTIS